MDAGIRVQFRPFTGSFLLVDEGIRVQFRPFTGSFLVVQYIGFVVGAVRHAHVHPFTGDECRGDESKYDIILHNKASVTDVPF